MACGSPTVMKSLKNAPDYWEVDKVNSELKIHTLQEELERTQLECRRLQEKGQVGRSRLSVCSVLSFFHSELKAMVMCSEQTWIGLGLNGY